MSDAQILLTVVLAFYLIESVHYVPKASWFEHSLRGAWIPRDDSGEDMPASLRIGNLTPFLCERIVVDGRPFSKEALSPERQQARLESWMHDLTALKVAGTAQFAFTFVAAPLASVVVGFSLVWLPVFVTIAALNVIAAVLFFRRHARLHPSRRWQRVERTAMIVLSPATAMRAAAALEPVLEAPVHPLAIAALLLDRLRFENMARTSLIDESRTHGFDTLQPLAASALARHGLTVERLLAAPLADDASSRTWCPRCRSQFTVDRGSCMDCGGLALLPLSQDLTAVPSVVDPRLQDRSRPL